MIYTEGSGYRGILGIQEGLDTGGILVCRRVWIHGGTLIYTEGSGYRGSGYRGILGIHEGLDTGEPWYTGGNLVYRGSGCRGESRYTGGLDTRGNPGIQGVWLQGGNPDIDRGVNIGESWYTEVTLIYRGNPDI